MVQATRVVRIQSTPFEYPTGSSWKYEYGKVVMPLPKGWHASIKRWQVQGFGQTAIDAVEVDGKLEVVLRRLFSSSQVTVLRESVIACNARSPF